MSGEKIESFSKPDFTEGSVEFRYQDDEICIYATEEGLEELIFLFKNLIRKKPPSHIHLEDYEILTNSSLKAVIGKF